MIDKHFNRAMTRSQLSAGLPHDWKHYHFHRRSGSSEPFVGDKGGTVREIAEFAVGAALIAAVVVFGMAVL